MRAEKLADELEAYRVTRPARDRGRGAEEPGVVVVAPVEPFRARSQGPRFEPFAAQGRRPQRRVDARHLDGELIGQPLGHHGFEEIRAEADGEPWCISCASNGKSSLSSERPRAGESASKTIRMVPRVVPPSNAELRDHGFGAGRDQNRDAVERQEAPHRRHRISGYLLDRRSEGAEPSPVLENERAPVGQRASLGVAGEGLGRTSRVALELLVRPSRERLLAAIPSQGSTRRFRASGAQSSLPVPWKRSSSCANRTLKLVKLP